MICKRLLSLAAVLAVAVLVIGPAQAPAAQAAPQIFASPIHAGCYLARLDLCKIHVEPFTINLAPGKQLVYFQLVAIRSGSGTQAVIYDFRPDVSNPLPASGSTVTPSPVAQDFAATCGGSYTISLQGQDSGDPNGLNLGLTGQFTCPIGTNLRRLPLLYRQ